METRQRIALFDCQAMYLRLYLTRIGIGEEPCAIDGAVNHGIVFRVGSLRTAALSLGLIGVASACASNTTVIKHSFPKATTLEKIASRPSPDSTKSMEAAPLSVSTWQLEGPFPDVAGAGTMQLSDALHTGVYSRLKTSRPNIVLTPNMLCFAREYGRFLGAHGERPQLDLQAFMAGRCGVWATPSVTFMTQDAGTPLPAPNGATIDQLVGSLPQSSDRGELGVWFGSGEKHQVLISAFAVPRVQLSKLAHNEETVRLAGQLLDATGWLQSHATVGALGFRACVPSPGSTARLPAFDLSCPVDSNDPSTVIDLAAGAPDAVLGARVLSLVVPLADPVSSTYQASEITGIANQGDLVAQLNAVRQHLELPALQNVPAQSQVAKALLPHYFGAAAAGETRATELIALGLMAGWDVEGPIRDANFASFMARRGDHSPSLLAELTYFPSTRSTLLDPNASKLAIATMKAPDSETVGGYVTTYTLFEDRRYKQYEVALLDELDRHRAAKNIGPVERVSGSDTDKDLDPIMTKLTKGKITPSEGMDKVLSTYASKLQRNFRGFILGTMVIDGWMPTFPADLVDAKKVAVTARVGYYTAKGTSWGQYVVYLIYTPI